MPQIDIKINTLADLQGFTKALGATKTLQKETEGLGKTLKEGLGLGGGIEIVRRGLDLFKEGLRETAGESLKLASEIKDGAEALGISNRAFQVLGEVMREAGGSQERMTQAISATNRALVDARALAGPATAAFRALGLDPAQLEGLNVEQRMAAIGRSVAQAKDQTEAFSAAGAILGSKNLPVLLSALKTLGEEGYDELAKKAEAAGRVMSDDTITRLHEAQLAIERWRTTMVIGVGESLAMIERIGQSFKANFSGTAGAFLSSLSSGNLAALITAATINAPKAENKESPANPASAASATALKNQLVAIKDAELAIFKAKQDQQVIDADSVTSTREKARLTLRSLAEELDARHTLIELLRTSKLNDNESEQDRQKKITQLETENKLLLERSHLLGHGGRRAASLIDDQAQGINDPRENKGFLEPSQGIVAGIEQYMVSVGSMGEQLAASIQNTLGTAVSGITDGIMSWIDGTKSFGQAIRGIGMSVLREMEQQLVRIGVQWLVNQLLVKTGIVSIGALQDEQRATGVAKTNAANLATLPGHTANAAAAGISSFGLALIFGAVAVALILALAGGFAEGGFTSPGGRNDVRGVVHAGEWVAPQWMVNNPSFGGIIGGLEAARQSGGSDFGGLLSPGSALTQPGYSPRGGDQGRSIYVLFDREDFSRKMQEDSEAWFHDMAAQRERNA